MSEQPFEDGVSPDASFQNTHWFANDTFIITFQNRAAVLAKPSQAVGAARHQKGTEDRPYGIKLVKSVTGGQGEILVSFAGSNKRNGTYIEQDVADMSSAAKLG